MGRAEVFKFFLWHWQENCVTGSARSTPRKTIIDISSSKSVSKADLSLGQKTVKNYREENLESDMIEKSSTDDDIRYDRPQMVIIWNPNLKKKILAGFLEI